MLGKVLNIIFGDNFFCLCILIPVSFEVLPCICIHVSHQLQIFSLLDSLYPEYEKGNI